MTKEYLSKLFQRCGTRTSRSPMNTTVYAQNKDFFVVAKTLNRYGISDMVFPAVISDTLQGTSVIPGSDLSNVVDGSKIRGAQQKERSMLINTSMDI